MDLAAVWHPVRRCVERCQPLQEGGAERVCGDWRGERPKRLADPRQQYLFPQAIGTATQMELDCASLPPVQLAVEVSFQVFLNRLALTQIEQVQRYHPVFVGDLSADVFDSSSDTYGLNRTRSLRKA